MSYDVDWASMTAGKPEPEPSSTPNTPTDMGLAGGSATGEHP